MSLTNQEVVVTSKRTLQLRDSAEPEFVYPQGMGELSGRPMTDAVIGDIVSSAECGSNFHMYEDMAETEWGILVPGHEPVIRVNRVAPGTFGIEPGDFGFFAFNISCRGICSNCKPDIRHAHGPKTHACLITNPGRAGAAWGYSGAGPWKGAHQKRMLFPFASRQFYKLDPAKLKTDNYLLNIGCLPDSACTGWHAARGAGVGPGKTVMIAGQGAIGLSALLACSVMGASHCFVTDGNDGRLRHAESLFALLGSRMKIKAMNIKEGHDAIKDAARAFMGGVQCFVDASAGVEACGLGASANKLTSAAVTNQAIDILEPTGVIGQVAAYFRSAPGSDDELARKGMYLLNWGLMFDKHITVGANGQCPAGSYIPTIFDLVNAGQYPIAKVIGATCIPWGESTECWKRMQGGEVIKPLIDPNEILAQHLTA